MENTRGHLFEQSMNRLRTAALANFETLVITAGLEQQLYHSQPLPATSLNSQFLLHSIDLVALTIFPHDAPQNLYPVNVGGDGNCLFRSFSLALFGTESCHLEMRARAIVELIGHSYHYLSIQEMFHTNDNQLLFWLSHYSSTADTSFLDMTNIQNIFEVLKAVIVESLAQNSWVGMWQLAALASVSQKTVMSIYPAEQVVIATTSMVRRVLNRLVYPRIAGLSTNSDFIPIMWTSSVLPTSALWRPNHFVLCVTRPQTQPEQMLVHKPHVHIPLPKVVAPTTPEETVSTVVKKDQNMTKYQKRKLQETSEQRELRLAKRRRLYALKKQKLINQKHEQSEEHIKQRNTESTQKQEVSHENPRYINEDRTNFIKYISQYPKNHCHYCKRKLFPNEEKKHLSKSGENIILCGKCQSSLSRNEVPTLAYQNKLDPGQIPIELSNLNMMEKRLISQIHLYVTIVTLPGGQLGEKGQAIHFPIDVPKQWKNLPIPATE